MLYYFQTKLYASKNLPSIRTPSILEFKSMWIWQKVKPVVVLATVLLTLVDWLMLSLKLLQLIQLMAIF